MIELLLRLSPCFTTELQTLGASSTARSMGGSHLQSACVSGTSPSYECRKCSVGLTNESGYSSATALRNLASLEMNELWIQNHYHFLLATFSLSVKLFTCDLLAVLYFLPPPVYCKAPGSFVFVLFFFCGTALIIFPLNSLSLCYYTINLSKLTFIALFILIILVPWMRSII